MKYERYNEDYPDPEEKTQDGSPRKWPWFGYPQVCLELAVAKDDPKGFRFYFDRYFSLDAMTIGGSLVLLTANKGAEKCVRELIKIGAADPAYNADELIARAKSHPKHRQAA